MTMDYGHTRTPLIVKLARPVPYALAVAAEAVCAVAKGGAFLLAAVSGSLPVLTSSSTTLSPAMWCGIVAVSCVVAGCITLLTPWPVRGRG